MIKEMKTALQPHQVAAVEKLSKIKVGALYMEMGLGKTRTAMELINIRFEKERINHVIWLCPCSVITNLKEDVMKHSDDFLPDATIMGIESISQSDRTYIELLKIVERNKCFLVVDESNLVKNFFAKRTKRIAEVSLKCEYRLILNGTPVTRNEADLFSQWYILDRRIFGYRSFWSFAANHLEYDDYGKVRRVLNVDYLTDKIAPYSFQLKKTEVLKDLPSKNYYSYYFDLTEAQRYHYRAIRDEMLAQVDEFDSSTIYRLLTALQLVSSGRRITSLKKHIEHVPFFDDPECNPRIEKLMQSINNEDDKCIIWCKYHFEMDDIKKALETRGLSYAEFHGAISLKKRDIEIERFRKDAQFLIANKASGRFGLNLQFCSNAIYYSNDFDWGTRAQSEDRIHRIGQKDPVFIYDIIADISIDDMIQNNLSRKGSLDSYITYLLNNKNHIKTLLRGDD